jgi:hypothetical protein
MAWEYMMDKLMKGLKQNSVGSMKWNQQPKPSCI